MRAGRGITSITGVLAMLFGVLTVASGGRALFGGADMGAVVPFVLWFNFLAGFAYVLAGLGLWRRRPWAAPMALALFVATAAVFGAFGLHMLAGRAYEMRTLGAMLLRTAFWAVAAIVARRGRAVPRAD
ncbi:hypothetical protein [Acidimangrovimonas pyrenivorans]|uniref:Uncharacterized protein n=1 Tax=Acidimangrovimonas pyrenivorans TaxID=2030798 RepID=A0ABV7AFX7_9RHOB